MPPTDRGGCMSVRGWIRSPHSSALPIAYGAAGLGMERMKLLLVAMPTASHVYGFV